MFLSFLRNPGSFVGSIQPPLSGVFHEATFGGGRRCCWWSFQDGRSGNLEESKAKHLMLLLISNSYPLIAKKNNQKVISFYFKGSVRRLERNFGPFLILFFSSLPDFERIQESCLGGQDEDILLPFWGGGRFFSVKRAFLAWDDRISFDITDEQRPVVGYFKIDAKKQWTWFMFFVTQKPRIRQHRQWRRPVARHEFAGLATVLAPETEKRGVWIDSPKRESVGLADLWFSTQLQHMWACRCWPIFLWTFAQLQTLVFDAGWLPSSSSLRSF